MDKQEQFQGEDWNNENYVNNSSDQTSGLANFFTNKRIIRMLVRWILTVILYYAFWHVAWVRWSLIIVAPMIAFNMGMLIWYYRYLRKDA